MAYNGGFPMTYQPATQFYYPQYQNQALAQQPQTNAGGIIWVQGEAGAKSYLVAPNTTVQLWDSENQVIYLKSADATGMPSIKVLEYTVRDFSGATRHPNFDMANNTEYALRSDLEALKRQLEALQSKMNAEEGNNNG